MASQIGVIGLAVMGENLARNLSRFFTTSVYNRTVDVTMKFMEQYSSSSTLVGYPDLKSFVLSLERPRKMILMVKAGAPVDSVISELLPFLELGDIIIDWGNSHYKDTVRRSRALHERGIEYVGCGISGGEEWALNGPSIMPGCSEAVWKQIEPILTPIAAKDFSGGACVSHIGNEGAGHYVKMVHNGIEYAIMQMIAEAYETFRKVYHLSAPQIGAIFEEYNTGILDSYLIEITGKVLMKKDDFTERFVIDMILDRAGAKGTWLWTSVDALESGMSVSSIVEATFARMVSSDKPLRTTLGKEYEFEHTTSLSLQEMRMKMEYTLYLGMLFAYAQGLALIRARSIEYGWQVNLAEVTRIWQGGCIIRSQILTFLTDAYTAEADVPHIFGLAPIHDAIEDHLATYQQILSILIQSNIATPALSSALQYFYQMVTVDSSANMIQGLRDYFGAHTYERNDREGVFHTDWSA